MQLSYLGQRPVILAPEWSEALQTKGRAALLQEGGSSVSIPANESALALGMSREPARAWAGVRAASHRPQPLVIAVHTTASPGQLTQPPALEEASRSTADSCGQWGTQGSELRVKGCFTGKNTWTF